MAKQATLETLFQDGLRDIYYAERKALQGLRKMARGVKAEELRTAFETHHDETEGQIQRLQQVFEIICKRAQGKTCAAIDGIQGEAEEMLEEYKDSPALDASILAAAQAFEHYEITRYGTLAAWTDHLGHADAAGLLRETLAEGGQDRRTPHPAGRERRQRRGRAAGVLRQGAAGVGSGMVSSDPTPDPRGRTAGGLFWRRAVAPAPGGVHALPSSRGRSARGRQAPSLARLARPA